MHDLVKARLNLYAVLQNLEELVRLDEVSAALVKNWDVGVQFAVIGGPAASLVFKNGACRHVCGKEDVPIKLLFRSPKHLNDMFDGKAMPIPVKGFSRLGFLKNDFNKLTKRLEYYLKGGGGAGDAGYMALATRLKLATAACAARELAEFDPDGKIVAAGTPDGTLLVEIAPDGPAVSVVFQAGRAKVTKGTCPSPLAKMTFEGLDVAQRVLSGTADVFQEVALGRLMLRGRIPIIDSFGLLLDRIPRYLPG